MKLKEDFKKLESTAFGPWLAAFKKLFSEEELEEEILSERSTGQAPWYLCRPKGRVQAALAPYPPAPDVLYIV